MSKIIFVGAGPIALLTAVQIKLYQPDVEIELFEKYTEYTRKHTLNVDKKSFDGAHPDPRLQALIQQYHGQVPTFKIESELKKLALDLGVKITYREIKDVKELLKEQRDAFLCIGADGSHSVVRSTFFANDQDIPYQNLQYLLELKGSVKGNLSRLDWAGSAWGLFHVQRFIQENVGKYDAAQDATPYTLRMFISGKEFEALRGTDPNNPSATFKNPLNLESLATKNPYLANEFKKWLAYRQTAKPDFELMKGMVTTTNLPAYTSTGYVIEEGNQTVCLVGDAALGIPYFRSFNAGVTGSIQLAKTVNIYMLGDIFNLSPYEDFMNQTASSELFHARVKGAKYRMGDDLFYASRVTSDTSSAFVQKSVNKKISFSYDADDSDSDNDSDTDSELTSGSKDKCTIL